MNTSDMIALLALIVAAFSMVLSGFSMFLQTRLNRTNLEAKYYELIFNNYILTTIPSDMADLKFDPNSDMLNDSYKKLIQTIMEMVRKARYFKYSNKKFYKDLSDKAKEIEDLLFDISSKPINTSVKQRKRLEEVESKIGEVIILINKNYSKIK